MTSIIFERFGDSSACGALAGMRTTMPGTARTRAPPIVNASVPVQDHHEDLVRGGVLAQFLTLIEREEGHVSSGSSSDHAACNPFLGVRDQRGQFECLCGRSVELGGRGAVTRFFLLRPRCATLFPGTPPLPDPGLVAVSTQPVH
jgi:hypothetical protein